MSESGARTPAPARDSATVVLARDGREAVEVLLLERHRESRFAPGAFAFPGGRLEPEDTHPDWEGFCRGVTAAVAAGRLRDVEAPHRALGFWITALREAFEETGLLLAYDAAGAPLTAGAVRSERLLAHRARCRGEGAAFRFLLTEERLTLATDRMAYWAHWITPEERPIRFDTRFFVAAAFPDAEPEPDGVEVVGWRWLTPDQALAGHRAGELTLPVPTQRVLASIAAHPDVSTLLAAAAARDIRPIRPRVIQEAGRDRILLPGDPGWF